MFSIRASRRTGIAVASLVLLAIPAGAQKLTCLTPADAAPNCKLASRSPSELLVVQAIGPDGKSASGIPVSFTTSKGEITSAATTGPDGKVQVRWTAAVPSTESTAKSASTTDEVLVDVVALIEGNRIARRIVLERTESPDKTFLVVRGTNGESGNDQRTFVERQLRWPLKVIVAEVDSVKCTSTRVSFRDPMGGVLSLDTVRGYWKSGECSASTRWKLGPSAGIQTVRAVVVDKPDAYATFTAKAHTLPWIGVGLAYSRPVGYETILSTAGTAVRVKRKIANAGSADSSEISYDSIPSKKGLNSVPRSAAFTPIIGVNSPLFLGQNWSRLRFSLSADARHLDRDWFVGVSVPQALRGLVNQGNGVDLQIVAHISRQELADGKDCGPNMTDCRINPQVRFASLGAMIQVNTTSILGAILAALPK